MRKRCLLALLLAAACAEASPARSPGGAVDEPPSGAGGAPATRPLPANPGADRDGGSGAPNDPPAPGETDAQGALVLDARGGAASDARPPLDAPPPSALCPGSALVCDDFEDGDFVGWSKAETGGRFEIEGTHVHGGEKAARLTIPGGQRGGFLVRRGAPLFPLPKKIMWGRAMVFFEDMAGGHFDTIRGAPSGGGTPWYNIGGQGKAFLLNYYNGGSDCWSVPSGRPAIPRSKWMCWEWMFDGAANRIQFWVDGKLLREVNGPGDGCVSGGNATWTAPTFGWIGVGEFNAQTTSAQTRLWIDDVALATEARIGCPAPPPTAR